ncbi:MAG: hypothetical protein RIQ52_2010 [Pseudomonadota bacterium]|jgi:ubiquinone biosynthesis protein UbiJ
MIPDWLLLRALESLLALVLRPDEKATRSVLAQMQQKVIAFDIRPVPGLVYFCPHSEGIQVLREFSGTPDLRMTGPAWAFLRLAMGADARELLFSGHIRLQGKADLAQRFNQLLAQVQFPGRQTLHTVTRSIQHYGAMVSSKLWLDGRELLQEETGTTPTRLEADEQFAAIDRLRDDCERLEARLTQLQQARQHHPIPHHQDSSDS